MPQADMSQGKEFDVNDHITLKLEPVQHSRSLETVIYVAGERFRQCKFLLLDIPVEKISSFDEIDSIDEAADRLDHSQERGELYERRIPPKTEFWGHCSNLQVWAEHEYDTRLIHSNLAFPLLKRLTEVGDPQAQRVFKEEIGNRLASGHRSTVLFLHEEGYLKLLSKEELVTAAKEIPKDKFETLWYDGELPFLSHEDRLRVLLEPEEAEAILELEKLIDEEVKIALSEADEFESPMVRIEDNHVIELNIAGCKIGIVSSYFKNFKNIKDLCLSGTNIKCLPDFISEFSELESLTFNLNEIEILPNWIGNLTNLKTIGIADNNINEIPETILKLEKLIEIDIYEDEIQKLNEESQETFKELKKKGIIFWAP